MTFVVTSPELNVYAGSESLSDFLHPGRLPPTPLVELPLELNAFHSSKVRVFVKLLFMTPLLNAKLFASRKMFDDAKAQGRLDGAHTLVENSSGNKILADIILAKLFGFKRVVATVPRDIPSDKQHLLELLGAECRKEIGGIEEAVELGKQPGWWNPAQYHNESNPSASEEWLGPQLWRQTNGEMTLLCAGIGTGGTVIGCTRSLKASSPNVTSIGIVPSADDVPGTRSLERLKEVGLDWKGTIDGYELVDAATSYFWSLRMCSRGILAGPSSGMALAGLFKYLRGAARLEEMRNVNGEIIAVVACPDSALLYLDKYTTRLDPDQLLTALSD
jgi:cysteine synthase